MKAGPATVGGLARDGGSGIPKVEITMGGGRNWTAAKLRAAADCAACHGLDDIQTDPPFPGAATWDAEGTKMIEGFGAAIDAADARTIIAYFKQHDGS